MIDPELKDVLLNINQNVITLQVGMNELRFDVNELKSDVTILKSQMVELRSDVAKLESRMDRLESRMDKLESKVDKLESKVDKLESKVDKLESRMDTLDDSVHKIHLTLENETNRKISVLFDSRVDEIRHRQENAETREKVANLEMRVDNPEKTVIAS